MEISIFKTIGDLDRTAAERGADRINQALGKRGEANIILATGASQIGMLSRLVKAEVDWSRVTAFHLDEYIGLPPGHGASFRKYLKERVEDQVPLRTFHYVDGELDPPGAEKECRRLGKIIRKHPIDVAFIGIGENGHLAFNDPPADLETEEPYLVVELDPVCRYQQYNEGWFNTLEEVPHKAISMSVRQILKSASIVCTVPGPRKAKAVKCALEGPVTPDCPASVLQTHGDAGVFLDWESSSLIRGDHR